MDIQRAHQILTGLDSRYVLINQYSDYPAEASNVFWDEIESHPEWFEKQDQWGDVAVFKVLR